MNNDDNSPFMQYYYKVGSSVVCYNCGGSLGSLHAVIDGKCYNADTYFTSPGSPQFGPQESITSKGLSDGITCQHCAKSLAVQMFHSVEEPKWVPNLIDIGYEYTSCPHCLIANKRPVTLVPAIDEDESSISFAVRQAFVDSVRANQTRLDEYIMSFSVGVPEPK